MAADVGAAEGEEAASQAVSFDGEEGVYFGRDADGRALGGEGVDEGRHGTTAHLRGGVEDVAAVSGGDGGGEESGGGAGAAAPDAGLFGGYGAAGALDEALVAAVVESELEAEGLKGLGEYVGVVGAEDAGDS